MSGLDWLMYANIAVWLGLGVYLVFIARNQKSLERRLAHLERETTEEGNSHA